MSLATHITLFCLVASFNCSVCDKFKMNLRNFSSLVSAIDQIVLKVFIKEITTTNIVVPDDIDKSSISMIKDFKQQYLLKSFSSLKVIYRQDSSEKIRTITGRKKRCNIFIVKTFRDFLKIYSKTLTQTFKFSGFFLVVLVDGEIPKIEEIFRLLWT